ncbi:MAG: penicillin-binding protein 2 [Acidimicrobiales bacterium]|nr:penicillin-binding protein 2 [Acidimicrobiales bacterium]
MNTQIRRLALVLMLCFAALFVQLNRVQVFGRQELEDNPENRRTVVRDYSEPRGFIATSDGVVVARSVEVDAELERQREYPEGDLYGHVTGFFSFKYGDEGLERVYGDELAGRTFEQRYESLADLFRDRNNVGNLTLTLRDDVQRAARDALGDRKGSVVVLDPRDGSVLALWSWPSYDPSGVSSVDIEAADVAWAALLADPNQPMLPRTYREIFFPGSTFKVVTAGAALDSNRVTPTDPVFPIETAYTPPLTTLPLSNFGGSACGGDLTEALRQSCNTVFARLAAEVLGPQIMVEAAENFGFNSVPPLDLPAVATSQFPTDYGAVVSRTDSDPPVDIVESTPLLAQAAIGQYDVKATPLQMALVAAAVANEGVIMEPHLMSEIRDSDGDLVESWDARSWRNAVTPTDAATLRRLMVNVVTNGTATGLQLPGFEVGGKTGTAQVTAERPDDTHAWVIAFAGPPGGAPEVAIAVVVESVPGQGQQTGGGVAVPIAQQVLQVALSPATGGG